MHRLEQLLPALYPTEREPFEITLVDVGSMGGLEDEWEPLVPHLRVIGFEPDAREFDRLGQSARERHLPFLVLDRSREATLYVSEDPGKSSIYRPNLAVLRRFPNPERYTVVSEVPFAAANVRTLDDALEDAGVTDPDVLKIDTQGSELLILQGATRTLQSVVAAKVEVEFLELYEGQPLFAEVDALLRASGFELIDLDRVFWKRSTYADFEGKGQLAFADALYFRDIDSLLDGQRDPFASAFRLAVVAVAYGMHDTAAVIAETYRARGLPSPEPLDALLQEIVRWNISQGGWTHRDGVLGNRPNRS
jgi:FkbM family methyltransferase